MTSFIIKSHVDREPAPQWKSEMDSMTACPFCRIAKSEAPAHKVYETDKVIAILGTLRNFKRVLLSIDLLSLRYSSSKTRSCFGHT